MRRGLDGFFLLLIRPSAVFKVQGAVSKPFGGEIARGKHLFPFRTEPLSLSAPMVLGGQPPGRVGRRRSFHESRPSGRLSSFRPFSAIASFIKRSSRASSEQKSRPEAALSLPAGRALPDRTPSRGPAVRAPDDPKRRFARARRPDRATGA